MIRVVIAELRKLRRPSLSLTTLLTVGALTGLFTSIVFLRVNSAEGNTRRGKSVSALELSQASGLVYGFKLVGAFLGIVALCIFASQTAQEYTHGTLRNLLVRQPSRMKILAGKFISMKLFAAVLVVFAGGLSIVISYALAGHAHVNTSEWSTAIGFHLLAQSALNIFISTLCYGALGMALGVLFRSPISAISVGVLWVLIIENILAAVLTNTARWLPGQNFANISEGGSPGASYIHSLVVSLLYITVSSVVIAILFKRRDVAN